MMHFKAGDFLIRFMKCEKVLSGLKSLGDLSLGVFRLKDLEIPSGTPRFLVKRHSFHQKPEGEFLVILVSLEAFFHRLGKNLYL